VGCGDYSRRIHGAAATLPSIENPISARPRSMTREGEAESHHSTVFARIRRNIGWLAGSTGFSAVTSITYVALAARTLGPRNFGSYILILTYAQLIGNLVQFQSWNAVIRYGAVHLEQKEEPALERLFGYTAMLEWASALVGALIAVTFVPIVGPYLHWSAVETGYATWFGAALLLTTGGTAMGILRLCDRFDLLVYSDGVGPLTRIVGAIAGWAIGGSVAWFLAVWAISALFQLIAQWTAALSLGHRLSLGLSALRRALAENPRIWPYMVKTNLSGSLTLFWLQCGTLTVGWVSGPIEAGGFRMAHRFAQAIMKPVEMLTKALFPELARLVAARNHSTLKNVLLRVSGIAACFAALTVVIAGLGGTQILHLIAGRKFEFAQPFFFLLAIASAIDLVGFALEPFHNAHGRAGRVLRSKLVAVFVYAALLAALLPTIGAKGAAFAAIGASLTIFVQLAISGAQILRKSGSEPEGDEAAATAALEATPDERLD
jgi:O-antigen/teichoic acid export membrane protein